MGKILKPPSYNTQLALGHPIAQGKQLAWLTNELTGTNLYDSSRHGNDGTISGGTWVNGKLSLDGSNDEISLARISGLTDWSVHLRFTPDDVTSISRTLLDQGDIFIGQIDDDIIYGATDTLNITYSGTVSAVLSAGAPVDIFVTRSGTTITCFVYDANGALSTGSFTATGTPKSDATNLVIGAPSRTAFVYPVLIPASLTAEKGLLITASDDLQISRGSAPLNPGVDYENLNGNQGTLEFWIRPNWNGDDDPQRYFFDMVSGSNRIRVRKREAFNDLRFEINDKDGDNHDVSHDISDWDAGTWYHVVCTWDFNADAMALYTNGTVRDNTGHGLSSDSLDAIGATYYIGQDVTGSDQMNAAIKYHIRNRPITVAEITALYAAGAGHLDTTVVGSDTVAYDDFTNQTAQIVFRHRGQSVTATTASQLTVAEAVGGRSWGNNDDVVVSDATGFKVTAKINEPGGILTTDTTLDLDGISPASLAKVGVSMFSDGTYYAQGGDVLDIVAEDFEIDFWIRQDGDPGTSYIMTKLNNFGSPSVRWGVIFDSSGNLSIRVDDDTNDAFFGYDITPFLDDRWHHYHYFADRSDISLCTIAIDGVAVSPFTSGVFPVNTLTNTEDFTIGATDVGSGIHEGYLKFVKIHIGGTMATAAQILYAATHPGDVSGSSWTADGTREYWLFDENTGTTITAGVTSPGNDLTLSDAAAWNQQAFISLNRLADGNMENGGIGAWTIVATPTLVDKETDTDSDSQSLHIVSAADNDGVSQAISASNGDKFYLAQRHKVTAGSFEVNVTNGGGGIETGIADASWTALEKIITATGNLTFQWLGEAAGDDWNISKASILSCVAGNALVAGTRYTRVFNVDTSNVGAEWSGLGSDATEVQAGDLYIVDDTATASTAIRTRNFAAGDVDGVAIWDRALSAVEVKRVRDFPYEDVA